jgi:hypothetical protein
VTIRKKPTAVPWAKSFKDGGRLLVFVHPAGETSAIPLKKILNARGAKFITHGLRTHPTFEIILSREGAEAQSKDE